MLPTKNPTKDPTKEMRWLGFHVCRWRLVVLMVLMVPVLIGLAHDAGVPSASCRLTDAIDIGC